MRDNDVLRLARWGAIMLALMIMLAWGYFNAVSAAPPTRIHLVALGALGSDSSDVAPDSVNIVWIYGINAAARDSLPATPLGTDSLTWVLSGNPSTLGFVQGYMPTVWAVWYWGDEIIRGNVELTPPWTMAFLDSLDQTITATATVSKAYRDSIAAQVDTVLTAAHPGDWAATGAGGGGTEAVRIYVIDTSTIPDSKVDGADIYVYNASRVVLLGQQTTGSGGFGDFALDTATGLQVAVTMPGYLFRDSSWTGLNVSAPMQDTAFVYTLAASPLPGADSCLVSIYTDVPYCLAKIWISDPASGPIQDTIGTTLNRNEIRPRPKANASGVIQVSLIRAAATTKVGTSRAKYTIELMDTRDNVFARFPGYSVPSSSTATLTVTP